MREPAQKLADQAIRNYYACVDSVLSQSRGDAGGMDGWSAEDAQQAARRVFPALSRARLFVVDPARFAQHYHMADRFTCGMAGYNWTPVDGHEPPEEETKKLWRLYEEAGTGWPFPDPLPFDACYFAYADGVRLALHQAFTRIRERELAKLGYPDVRLLGHLLWVEGEEPAAVSFLAFNSAQIGLGAVSIGTAYDQGEWFQPASLDPWSLAFLVRSVNDHKTVVQPARWGLPARTEKRKFEKGLKRRLPLPPAYYLLKLKDELVEEKPLLAIPPPSRHIEWSHRWDVRGHEVVRVQRGPMPIDPRLRAKLLKRGYRLYEERVTEVQDLERLFKRGVRRPELNEMDRLS